MPPAAERHGTGDRLRPGGSDEILLTTPAREGAAGIRRLATEVAAPLRDAFG